MGQNITINLDGEIIQKARVLAARRQTSISRMLGQELERVVRESERYEQAKAKAFAHMRQGWHMGGQAVASREDLHETKSLR
ncbi:MAG: hypothetical protein ABFD97_16845 [Syntrophobacter sp.]